MSRLDGRKLLLTRSAEDSADWAETIAAEGALPIILPCITAEPSDDPNLVTSIAGSLEQIDWIVFTSRRGVDAFARLRVNPLPASVRFAAVGEATAQSCRERFGRVDLVGGADRDGGGTAAALGTALATDPSIGAGANCLLALAANAGDVLERKLTEAGASVTRIDVYRTVPAEPREQKRALSTLDCDTVIFASPTAVTGFDNQIDIDIEPQFVTIGPSTSAAVRAHHWDIAAEAKEPTLSGIIESLLETAHV